MNSSEEKQQSRSISIMDIMILARKFWIFILSTIVVCTVIGILCAKFIDKPKYTATADIIVTYVDTSGSVAGDRNALLYGLELCGTVRDFAKTTSVYNDMQKYFDPESDKYNKYVEKGYRGAMNITLADENTTVIHVSYSTYSGKEYAIETVNQIITSIVDVANSKNEDGTPKFKALNGNIAPFDPTETASVSNRKTIYVIGGFGVGCLIAFAFVLIKHLLDDTIKSKHDIEEATGFKAIAFIEDLVLHDKK
ncbi:MAG: YveK family protein [Christensenellaceae bacterium]